jgi:hypothetical protein
MQHADVFNGDADGICSLIQLRLALPKVSKLVTGVKRDIALLTQLDAKQTQSVTALDISFDKNATAVQNLLDAAVSVDYFDHHQAESLFEHPLLTTHINQAAETCTALIVNKTMNNRYLAWALTGAYGDNLAAVADKIGLQQGFTKAELTQLNQLGTLLNYNGYGASLDDLFFHPAELYQKLLPFETPFAFLQQDQDTFNTLEQGYQQDMAQAESAELIHQTASTAAILLPNAKWARRVSGVFSNQLANQHPERAHAVISEKQNGGYLVSVRAPLNNSVGADELVSQFPSGGGRRAAAGINHLAEADLPAFIEAFQWQYRE